MPGQLDAHEPTELADGIRSDRLGRRYAGLGLACPFLSDDLCATYEQRPIACREHMVIGSAAATISNVLLSRRFVYPWR